MAVNFEFQNSERRYKTNLENIIRKYDRPFADDDVLDLTRLEIVQGNGKLQHTEPRFFGTSRLRVTKRRDSSDSAYRTASSDSAVYSKDERSEWDIDVSHHRNGMDSVVHTVDSSSIRHRAPDTSVNVSHHRHGMDSTEDLDANLIRYRASHNSVNVSAVEEIIKAVIEEAKEGENSEELSDAETISDASTESDFELSDSEMDSDVESEGCAADVDTEEEIRVAQQRKPPKVKSLVYEGDVDTDITAQMSILPASSKRNCNPLLEKLFKKPIVNAIPSVAAHSDVTDDLLDDKNFVFTRLKPKPYAGVQGLRVQERDNFSNDTQTLSSDGSSEDEIVLLDYERPKSSETPLNTTYVLKIKPEPAEQTPSKTSDRQVSSKTSDRQMSSKTSDRQTPSKTSDIHMPSKTSDRQMPSKTSDRRMPSKTSDRQMPSKTSDKQMPSKTSDREMPDKTIDKQTSSKTSDRQVSSKTIDRHMPSKTSDVQTSSKTSDGQMPSKTSDRHSTKSVPQKSHTTAAEKTGNENTDVASEHDSTLVQMNDLTFDPIFNSTRIDIDEHKTLASSSFLNHHSRPLKYITMNSLKISNSSSEKKKNSDLPVGSNNITTADEVMPDSLARSSGRSVKTDLFSSQTHKGSGNQKAALPTKGKEIEEENNSTLENPPPLKKLLPRTKVLSCDSHQVRGSHQITSQPSPTVHCSNGSTQSLGERLDNSNNQSFQGDINSAPLHPEQQGDHFFRTPDLHKFKQMNLNQQKQCSSAGRFSSSDDHQQNALTPQARAKLEKDLQQQFDELFYKCGSPFAALVSPMPIRKPHRRALNVPKTSPFSVVNRLRNLKVGTPLKSPESKMGVSSPVHSQVRTPSQVVKPETLRNGSSQHFRAATQSALPRLVTYSQNENQPAASKNPNPPLLNQKKVVSNTGLDFREMATSTPHRKRLKDPAFECGISAIACDSNPTLERTPTHNKEIQTRQSPDNAGSDKARRQKQKDQRVLQRKSEDNFTPSCSGLENHQNLVSGSDTELCDSDNGEFDFLRLANAPTSPRMESRQSPRARRKAPRKEKASVQKESLLNVDSPPGRRPPSIVQSPHKPNNTHKEKSFQQYVYELNSDEDSDFDMSIRPLSMNSARASREESPENPFESRVKKLRSRNRPSVSARKSLSSAFCIAVSSGSGSASAGMEHGCQRPAAIASKRRHSPETSKSESEDWCPPAKRRRNVRKISESPDKNDSVDSIMRCEGPGRCNKLFCFSCSDLS